MQISCALAPGPHVVEHVVEAEKMGYTRAWLYDSPALYSDIWMLAALAADRTSTIGIGPAVLVPNLRHPLTQASAIATLEHLAPGRAVVAIGTGFTGRMAMGQKPLTWAYTRRYIEQLRALLRGDKVEVDGAIVQMLHNERYAPDFPITTPIIIAANGPKGLAVAHDLGDGVMTIGAGDPSFSWCSVLAFGTVLDEGEDPNTSPRVLHAAGPAMTVVYHALYEGNPESVDALPGGPEWRAALEQLPENERHLAVHKDHLDRVTERDRPLFNGDILRSFSWTGTAGELRPRLDALEAAGATEILYGAIGPDITRELETFMEMATR